MQERLRHLRYYTHIDRFAGSSRLHGHKVSHTQNIIYQMIHFSACFEFDTLICWTDQTSSTDFHTTTDKNYVQALSKVEHAPERAGWRWWGILWCRQLSATCSAIGRRRWTAAVPNRKPSWAPEHSLTVVSALCSRSNWWRGCAWRRRDEMPLYADCRPLWSSAYSKSTAPKCYHSAVTLHALTFNTPQRHRYSLDPSAGADCRVFIRRKLADKLRLAEMAAIVSQPKIRQKLFGYPNAVGGKMRFCQLS